nr:hypothetical protein P5660_16030 [Bacillus velezensis]
MTAEIKTGEKMIVFMINGKEYAISVSQVKSIEKWQKPTRFRCGILYPRRYQSARSDYPGS